MSEECIKIKGLNHYYVSRQGNIKSVKSLRTMLLKPFKSKNKSSYYEVYFSENGKVTRKYIHRLMAETFLPIPKGKNLEVNHINGNKLDNRLENLEWVSHKENMRHAKKEGLTPRITRHKFSEEEVLRLRGLYKTGNYLQIELAKMFNMSKINAHLIINRKIWTHI